MVGSHICIYVNMRIYVNTYLKQIYSHIHTYLNSNNLIKIQMCDRLQLTC